MVQSARFASRKSMRIEAVLKCMMALKWGDVSGWDELARRLALHMR